MKTKHKKIKIPKDIRKMCPRCGFLDIEELNDLSIVCNNLKCLAVSKFDKEENELYIQFEVKEK